MPVTEYQKQVDEFLASAGISFNAVLVGNDCPRYCDDALKDHDMDKLDVFPRRSHIHGKHYRCTLQRIAKHCKGNNCAHYQEQYCGCKCNQCKPTNISFEYWNSYADEEQNYCTRGGRNWESISTLPYDLVRKYKGKRPTKVAAYDLLSCLQKSDPGDFEQFCGDFGYDTDSRRAEDTWRAIVAEWQKVKRFFTANELEQLEEIAV